MIIVGRMLFDFLVLYHSSERIVKNQEFGVSISFLDSVIASGTE